MGTGAALDVEAIDALLADAVERGAIQGAVGLVADLGGTLYAGAFGHSDGRRERPMAIDTIFRLASMTKLFTAVAVMQLVDDGLLDLDEQVASFLPEFGELQVFSGFDGDRPLFRPPVRGATVRELVAHTSGLSYDVWNADVMRYSQLSGVPGIASGLRATLLTPLIADPAITVEYGTGLDWAGLVVEAVSGEPLDQRYRHTIAAPLELRDTSTVLDDRDAARCAPILRRDDKGAFAETDLGYPAAPEFCTGGGCLYSTASDFCRLELALLGGGAYDGRRILSPASSEEMFRPQTGELRIPVLRTAVPQLSCDVALSSGDRWGMGMCINDKEQPGMRRRGSGGWAGIFNTYFWIDRLTGLAAGLFMQYVPFYDAVAAALLRDFERAVYRSLRRG